MWTAAILAGGQGTRPGGCDKGALQVGDRSILARQVEILRPLAAHLLIIGSHAAEQDVRGVNDRIPGTGARGRHHRHPLCASYQRRVAPHMRRSIDAGLLRIDDARRGLLVRELGPHELEPLNTDGRLLFNVNTPDDYAAPAALADRDA